jgi:hypothetical protein
MNTSFVRILIALVLGGCGSRVAVDGAAETDAGRECVGAPDRDASASSPAPTATPQPTATQPPPACTLDPGFPAGTSVVACGFPPHVTLIGGDDAALYVLTESGMFYRVDKTSGTKTLLYTAPNDGPSGPVVFALGQGNDAALAGGVLLAFTLGRGVWSLDTSAPSMPVKVLGDVFENPPLVDSTSMYFLRAEMAPGSVQYVDVERVPIGGGKATVLDPTYDTPVALGGGFVYVATEIDGSYVDPPYPHLRRVPIAGGPVTTVLETLDTSGSAGSIAADAEAVYVIGYGSASGTQAVPVTRFPADGGAPTTLTVAGAIDPEVPGPVPWGLRLDDAFVYYVASPQLGAVFGTGSAIYRIPNAAPMSTPQLVAQGTSIGPPLFDAEFVYLALQRGGTDGPIEGAVLRVPKGAPK